jgi:hypothetical protein
VSAAHVGAALEDERKLTIPVRRYSVLFIYFIGFFLQKKQPIIPIAKDFYFIFNFVWHILRYALLIDIYN